MDDLQKKSMRLKPVIEEPKDRFDAEISAMPSVPQEPMDGKKQIMMYARHGYRKECPAFFPDYFTGYDSERRMDNIAATAFDKTRNMHIPSVIVEATQAFCDAEKMQKFWLTFKDCVVDHNARQLFLTLAEYAFMPMENNALDIFERSMRDLKSAESKYKQLILEYQNFDGKKPVNERNLARQALCEGIEYLDVLQSIERAEKRQNEMLEYYRSTHEFHNYIPDYRNKDTAYCRYFVRIMSKFFCEKFEYSRGKKTLNDLIDVIFPADNCLSPDLFRKAYNEYSTEEVRIGHPWSQPVM